MPAIERVIPLVGHLPASIREALARRLRELAGLALIALSGVAAAALMTWSVQDPSLSHATSRAIRNILGYPGAIGADLLMQIIGLGAIMLILPVAVWGWRMLTHRTFDREALRIGCWILCTVISAGFASCWAHGGAWPLPTGLGGVVGDALVRAPAVVFGPPGLVYRLVLGVILFAAMVATFLFASGMGSRPQEEELTPIEDDDAPFVEEDDRGSVSLGWVFHAVMSAKARLAWLFSLAYRSLVASAPQPRAASFERQEPNLGGRAAPSLAPQAEEDFDDEEEDEEEVPAARAPRKKAAPRAPPAQILRQVRTAVGVGADGAESLGPAAAEQGGARSQFARAGKRARRFRRPRRNRQGQSRPRRDAVRTRTRARHQIVARHRARRRHRALDERAVGARRRGPRPQRHRHRTAERASRKGLSARIAHGQGRIESAKLPLCLGKNIGGESIIIDLARTPHMLIAGTTGSGKSVAINTMILSLVYRLRPDQCRLIMVDPKMLELSVYDGIPHLLTPVVTDPKKAVVALKWAVREMEERYKKMSKLGVRNIDGYNQRLLEARTKGEELSRTVHTGFDKETGKAIYEEEKLDLDPLPYIVIIVDEMADLMMVAGKDIEGAVQRLAQMARAAGLHVILATQRPSVDVITGTIKANFPTRISFQVTSKIDSRTILGEMGAEQLLGQGDMLYMAGGGRISRVHGPFVSDEEVEKVVRHLKTQGQPEYLEAVTAEEPTDEDGAVFDSTGMGGGGRRRPVLAGGGDRQARPQGLHQLHPAPAADRI